LQVKKFFIFLHKISYMNKFYAKEKFHLLLIGVLDGEGLKSRLINASINFVALEDDDFSDEQKPLWIEIKSIITSEKHTCNSNGDIIRGSYENSINKLDELECRRLIEKIFSLYDILKWGYDGI